MNEDIIYHYVLKFEKDNHFSVSITPIVIDISKSTTTSLYLLENKGRQVLDVFELDCLMPKQYSMYSFDSERFDFFLKLCVESKKDKLDSAILQYQKSLDDYIALRNYYLTYNKPVEVLEDE